MVKKLQIEGMRFGMLVASELIGKDNNGKALWKCSCDCGETRNARASDLKRGKIVSCGCKKRTHGLSNHRLHSIFGGVKNRCYQPKSINYKYYGGKGIVICDEWLNDFTKFYEWALSNGYRDDLELDRIDSNGNYEPSNCKWSTRTEQTRNQKARESNPDGVRGVKFNKAKGKWEVNIHFDKKRLYLGLYDDVEEAKRVRKEAELKYWN